MIKGTFNNRKQRYRINLFTLSLTGMMLFSCLTFAGCDGFLKQDAGPMWYHGTDNIDTVTNGKSGDYYIDTDDYILYQKNDSGVWEIACENFGKPGEQGEKGEDGLSLLSGTTVPNSQDGKVGDLYLNTETGDIYKKLLTGWSEDPVMNIKGAGGQNNDTKGGSLLIGTDSPTEIQGKDGDVYLNTNTYALYKRESGVWNPVSNKISEIEDELRTGEIDIERLSSYQNKIIYDKTNVITNQTVFAEHSYINVSNGNIHSENPIYFATETYLSVKGNANYVFFINERLIRCIYVAYYDIDKNFISGSTTSEVISIQTPENACYVRFSVINTRATYDEVTSPNSKVEMFEQYTTSYSAPKPIAEITGIDASETLINGSITAEKCEFFDVYDSPNLIKDVKENYYMGTGSSLEVQNSNYVLFTNIKVSSGMIVNAYKSNGNALQMRFVTAFDSMGNIIPASATNGENVYTNSYLVPANCEYVAITIDKYNYELGKCMVQCTLDGKYLGKFYEPDLKIYKLKQVYLDAVISAEKPHIYLPPEICIAEGRTIELYNSQIVLNHTKYHFRWVAADFGRAYERKFTIEGTASLTGKTKTLELYLFDDELNMVDSARATVKFVSNNIETEQLIIPIGDSLTNNKLWLNKVNELSDGKIKFRGTQGTTDKKINNGITHEGRSGAGTDWYNLGTSEYTFKNSVENTLLDVKTKENGDKYTTNPFWNPTTNQFDFDYYCNSTSDGGAGYFQNSAGEEISIVPTGVQIFLGTNGMSLDSTTGVNNIVTLINNIRKSTKGANIPIYIVNTLFRPTQVGSVNADGFSTNPYGEFSYQADMKVMNLEIALYDSLKSYKNVVLVPVAATLDREYNFKYTEVAVNPYNDSVKIKEYTDTVHPADSGYLQMADIMYSSIAAHYKDA